MVNVIIGPEEELFITHLQPLMAVSEYVHRVVKDVPADQVLLFDEFVLSSITSDAYRAFLAWMSYPTSSSATLNTSARGSWPNLVQAYVLGEQLIATSYLELVEKAMNDKYFSDGQVWPADCTDEVYMSTKAGSGLRAKWLYFYLNSKQPFGTERPENVDFLWDVLEQFRLERASTESATATEDAAVQKTSVPNGDTKDAATQTNICDAGEERLKHSPAKRSSTDSSGTAPSARSGLDRLLTGIHSDLDLESRSKRSKLSAMGSGGVFSAVMEGLQGAGTEFPASGTVARIRQPYNDSITDEPNRKMLPTSEVCQPTPDTAGSDTKSSTMLNRPQVKGNMKRIMTLKIRTTSIPSF